MCFYNDDYAQFYSESFPVARKQHKCNECWQVIPAGTKYRRVTGKWDGDLSTFTLCDRCEDVRDKIEAHEIAVGCRQDEAVCPFGGIAEYLSEFDLTIESVAAGAPIAYRVIGDDE